MMSHIYEIYVHHDAVVHVRADLKGKHREHCLCYSCERMTPDSDDHCPIAAKLYALCVEESICAPVWECPQFIEK